MHPASTSSLITHPAHAAGSLAGQTIGRSVGLTMRAAKVGLRAAARVVGSAIERAGGPTPRHPDDLYPAVWVTD